MALLFQVLEKFVAEFFDQNPIPLCLVEMCTYFKSRLCCQMKPIYPAKRYQDMKVLMNTYFKDRDEGRESGEGKGGRGSSEEWNGGGD